MTVDNRGESLVFIDANVWLYAFIQTQDKQKKLANQVRYAYEPSSCFDRGFDPISSVLLIPPES